MLGLFLKITSKIRFGFAIVDFDQNILYIAILISFFNLDHVDPCNWRTDLGGISIQNFTTLCLPDPSGVLYLLGKIIHISENLFVWDKMSREPRREVINRWELLCYSIQYHLASYTSSEALLWFTLKCLLKCHIKLNGKLRKMPKINVVFYGVCKKVVCVQAHHKLGLALRDRLQTCCKRSAPLPGLGAM